MKTTALVIGGIAVLSIGGILVYKANKKDYKAEIFKLIPGNEKQSILPVLEQMTDDELKTTYEYLKLALAGKAKTASAELLYKANAIMKKYNIFT